MSSPLLTPDGGTDWEAFARKRNCYCSVWAKDPSIYQKQGLTPGFCGKCERCGVMGHSRHFPGPVPYTSAWCDRCYRIVGLTWLVRSPLGWIYLAALGAIVWVVGSFAFAIVRRSFE